MPNCTFCDQIATGFTKPAMCEAHLDLAVLCEFLARQGQSVTLQAVKETYQFAIKNGGQFALVETDIDQMMSGEFSQKYEVAQ